MLEPTNACEPNVVRLERRCGSAKRYAGHSKATKILKDETQISPMTLAYAA
jgi:hypothetical protein